MLTGAGTECTGVANTLPTLQNCWKTDTNTGTTGVANTLHSKPSPPQHSRAHTVYIKKLPPRGPSRRVEPSDLPRRDFATFRPASKGLCKSTPPPYTTRDQPCSQLAFSTAMLATSAARRETRVPALWLLRAASPRPLAHSEYHELPLSTRGASAASRYR